MKRPREAHGGVTPVANDTRATNTNSRVDTLNTELFTADSKARYAAEFRAAVPYTHVVLRDVCRRDALIAARNELINNVEAKYKETDLFKVYQTGDMANIDGLSPELAAKLPTLLSIRNAIYSQDFRHVVEQITGLPKGALIDKTDCSSNCYARAGHLLCHDDVIGTRRVSYIIYLTDPDEAWQANDGGALEMYAVNERTGEPGVVPTSTLLPQFNTMAMFTVQPGRSFHAVQEVFAEGRVPRERLELGLARDADDQLTADEHALLARWIHPQYLERSSLRKMVAEWEGTSCVQLRGFLQHGFAAKVLQALRAEDLRDGLGNARVPDYQAGSRRDWDMTGPCHKQRYLSYRASAETLSGEGTGAAAPGVGEQLRACVSELFRSCAFAKWLLKITDIAVQDLRTEIRRFRPGLDYTVAHGCAQAAIPELDLTLCFVDDEGDAAASAWASDDVGGFQCYVMADDEADEAAETYRADAPDDTMISCSASNNTLNLLLRDNSLMKFVKYVSHDAPSSRYDIAIEYGTDITEAELGDGEAADT